jgi:transposase
MKTIPLISCIKHKQGGPIMNYAQISTKYHYFCGGDMHSKTTYFKLLDQSGKVVMKKNMPNKFAIFKEFIEPYLPDVAVGVESSYNYYWLFDGCKAENIPFYLGHALYIKAISGNKKKSDPIDAETLANLMRTNFFPVAYPYPKEMRTVRDLLRRRHRLVRIRAEAFTHIKLSLGQNEIIETGGLDFRNKLIRQKFINSVDDLCLKENLETDAYLIDMLNPRIDRIEKEIITQTKSNHSQKYFLLQTIPGVGEMNALNIIYETHDVRRFKSAGQYASYCRVVKCDRISNGIKKKSVNQKIGNPYLKWTFGQILNTARRYNESIDRYYLKLERKKGAKIARAIMAHKFNTAAYFIMKNNQPFDINAFLNK